jgi:NADH-quinone oxidoreductase subunit J
MQTFFFFFCLALMVFSAAAVMMFRSLIKAAIWLAATSVLLAIALFLLGAYWAAIFELSVCAGLITAIFISAISFFSAARRGAEQTRGHLGRFRLLPYLLVLSGLTLLALLVFGGFSLEFSLPQPTAFAEFKEVFWNNRQTDILAQIALILAGAFAVIVLFKERGPAAPEAEPKTAGAVAAETGGDDAGAAK